MRTLAWAAVSGEACTYGSKSDGPGIAQEGGCAENNETMEMKCWLARRGPGIETPSGEVCTCMRRKRRHKTTKQAAAAMKVTCCGGNSVNAWRQCP